MEPGGTKIFQCNFTYPAQRGDTNPVARVDVDGAVTELNEDNNELVGETTKVEPAD